MARKYQRPHFDHEVPFWITSSPVFFVTTCAKRRGLNHFCRPEVGPAAIGAARHYNRVQRWFCSIIVLMPDHVHMLVSMSPDHDLSKSIGLWKRWLTKNHAIDWQPNFFEHRLRQNEDRDQKGQYIYENPVRAGLIKRAEEWPWTWMPGRD